MAKIGLGLAALGRPGYINLGHGHDLAGRQQEQELKDHTAKMLTLALENGIRYFDTARSYGKAEAFLVDWISQQNYLPSDFKVGSKWGYTYTADWKIKAEKHEIKAHTLENFKRQWQLSQALLPHLQLYQVHSATLDSGILDRKEVHLAMAQLKEQGIQIGLSLSGAEQSETLQKAMEIKIDGQPLFSSVQATFNLLERSSSGALASAHQEGWQIIVKESLANGRLSPANDRRDDFELMAILKKKSDKWKATIDAVALAYVLDQPWVDIVLSGAAVESHLQSNLKAMQLTGQIDWEDPEWAILEESPEQYWATRKGLPWN